MSNTRDLIDALLSGNSIEIEDTFNAAMSDKVSAKLDDYRASVAQTMFSNPQTLDVMEDDDNL
jgi:hypothetical protein